MKRKKTRSAFVGKKTDKVEKLQKPNSVRAKSKVKLLALLKKNKQLIKKLSYKNQTKRGKYLFIGIGIFTAISLITLIYLLKDLPSPRRLTNTDNYAVSTQIFDRNNKLLYEIFADEKV